MRAHLPIIDCRQCMLGSTRHTHHSLALQSKELGFGVVNREQRAKLYKSIAAALWVSCLKFLHAPPLRSSQRTTSQGVRLSGSCSIPGQHQEQVFYATPLGIWPCTSMCVHHCNTMRCQSCQCACTNPNRQGPINHIRWAHCLARFGNTTTMACEHPTAYAGETHHSASACRMWVSTHSTEWCRRLVTSCTIIATSCSCWESSKQVMQQTL